MAEGFKIAEAFVEIHAQDNGLRREVTEEIDMATVGQEIKVPVKADTEGAKKSFGSLFSTLAPFILPATGAVITLTGALAPALPALMGLGTAFGLTKLVAKDFGKAVEGSQDSLKKLGPEAQKTAKATNVLYEQFIALKKPLSDKIFGGLSGEMSNLSSKLMPALRGSLLNIGGAINDNIKAFLQWAGSAKTLRDIKSILDNNAEAGHNFSKAIKPIMQIITDISAVASQYLPKLAAHFATAAQKAADFISNARDTGKLKGWIDEGLKAAKSLWEIFKNLVGTLKNLAGEPGFGSNFLTTLKVVTDGIAWLSGNVPHLGEIISALFLAWKFVQVIQGITGIIKVVKEWRGAQILLNAVMDANPIGLVVIAVAALAAVFIYAYNHSESFRKIVNNAFNEVKKVVSAVVDWFKGPFTRFFEGIPGFFSRILSAVSRWFTDRWHDIEHIVSGAIDGIKRAINWFIDLPGKIGGWFNGAKDAAGRAMGGLLGDVAALPGKIAGALGNLGGLLINAGKSLIEGFGKGIEGAFGWVKKKVSGLMGSLRNLFPFSPAKEGPFSGSGYTSNSGAALMNDFGAGMASQASAVKATADNVLSGVQASFQNVSAMSSATRSPMAKAAADMLSSLTSGNGLFEDFSFNGMSKSDAKFNDQLSEMFYKQNGYGTASSSSIASFLQGVAGPGGSSSSSSSSGSSSAGYSSSSSNITVQNLNLIVNGPYDFTKPVDKRRFIEEVRAGLINLDREMA